MGFDVDSSSLFAVDGSLAVEGVSKRVDDSSQKLGANRHIDNGTSSSDDIALLDLSIVTKDDNTDVVRLQVERHTLDAAVKLYHLLGLDVLEAMDSSDTISDGEDLASFLEIDLGALAEDSLFEEGGELGRALLVGSYRRGGE